MARPGCKRRLGDNVISLHKRIRHVGWATDKTHVTLEIVRRMSWMKGFVVIRRRWGVERSFAWIMKCRRLVRDYEQLTGVAETLILIAAAATLLRRSP